MALAAGVIMPSSNCGIRVMKPVDSKVIDTLRIASLGLAALVAAAAIYQYMAFSGRPDASEIRDLWLIVELELAAIPLMLSLLVPRYESGEAAALAPTPAPRMPNPWSW